MRILVIAIGKEKDFAGYELVAEYSSRIGHYMPIEWRYIAPSSPVEDEKVVLRTIDKEGSGTYVIALDEKGKEHDSKGFADMLQGRMTAGARSMVFIIGGAYGLSDAMRSRADTSVALSRLTFPHQLVRLILAEQLFRACTIVKGEKYHH